MFSSKIVVIETLLVRIWKSQVKEGRNLDKGVRWGMLPKKIGLFSWLFLLRPQRPPHPHHSELSVL